MRLGLMLGYWGLGLDAEDQIALVQEAEAAGFDSVWTAEAYGSDAATPLAWFAAQTERIRIGAAILQMPGRSPAMTAMTAVTLDHLSNGRFILGLGSSGPQVAEGWHGQRFGSPARAHARVRGDRAQGAGTRATGVRGRAVPAAAARRAGQGAQADDRSGAGADPDLHRRDRPEEHPARGRDRRRLAAGVLLPRARGRLARAARGGRRPLGALARRLRHRAHRAGVDRRRRRPRPRRDAPLHRPLRGRHGLAREELLQPARAALRLRGGRGGDPGALPRRQEGRGGGGDPARADRPGDDVRPGGAGEGAARGLPRGRRGDPDRVGDGVRHRGAQAHDPRRWRRCSEHPPAAARRLRGPGSRLPGHRPGARAGPARPRRDARDLVEVAAARGARGHALRGRARVPGLPHARTRAQALRGRRAGRRGDARGDSLGRPRAGGGRHPHRGRRAGRRAGGAALGHAGAARDADGPARLPGLRARRRASRAAPRASGSGG